MNDDDIVRAVWIDILDREWNYVIESALVPPGYALGYVPQDPRAYRAGFRREFRVQTMKTGLRPTMNEQEFRDAYGDPEALDGWKALDPPGIPHVSVRSRILRVLAGASAKFSDAVLRGVSARWR